MKGNRMRVFVSLPVKDWTSEKLQRERDMVLSGVPGYFGIPESKVIEVPMIEPHQLTGQHPVYCLGINLQMMCQADLVAFHPDWKTSKACRLEHDICIEYGIPHVDLSHELGDGGYFPGKEELE